MQLTLPTLLALLALSPLALADSSSSSGSSSSSSSTGDSSSSGSSSSSSSSAHHSSSSGSSSGSSGFFSSTASGHDVGVVAYTLTGLNDAQASAYASFTSSRGHDTSAQASLSRITATASATALSSFDPYGPAVISALQNAVTATGTVDPPKLPSDLPKEVKSYWSSVYNAEISLLTKQATNTSNAAIGGPTAAVMAAGVGVMGAVGLLGMM